MPTTNTVSIATALVDSSHRFRKECMTMAIASIEEVTKHMRTIENLKGKETEATIVPKAHFRPYSSEKVVTGTAELTARTLETFPLEILEEFDPEQLYTTIFGQPVNADKLDLDIVRRLLTEEMKNACEDLCDVIFCGDRNSSGTNNLDCFNGFDTIIADEKALGTPTISNALGNFMTLGVVDSSNIGDKWALMYSKLDHRLKRNKLKLICSIKEKEMYDNWYANEFGHGNFAGVPSQTFLHGTNNRVEIVALQGMDNANHCFITTKDNMKVGYSIAPNHTKYEVRRPDNPNMVQFHVVLYMGVEFNNVSKEFLFAASRTVKDDTVYMIADKDTITFDDTALNGSDTATLKLYGFNITAATSLTIEGTNSTMFSVSPDSVSASDANATAGKEVTLTFAPTTAAGVKSAKLRVTNTTDNISMLINLSGKATT